MYNFDNEETWIFLDSRDVGGIETHVFHLADELQKSWGKVRVLLFDYYGPHPLINQLEKAGIRWDHFNGSVTRLFKVLSKKPKLLHTHGYKAGIYGRLAAFISGVPVVSTYHAGEPGEGRVRFYNYLDLFTAGMGEALTISPQIQNRILCKSHLISNFVSIPQKISGQTTSRVAFVGRLSHEKGPDLFCEIAKQNPDIDFRIYGDGPMRKELEHQYSQYVDFVGQVPNMKSLWVDIGLLCMPSRFEGLPYAALEAMANGVPVAAFDVGNLSQVITHNKTGWISPQQNIQALNENIIQWINMDLQVKKSLSSNVRSVIKMHYSPEAVVPKITKIYAKAIGTKNPYPSEELEKC